MQYLLLSDASNELIEYLQRNGPIQYIDAPLLRLIRTPNFQQYPANRLLSPGHIHEINASLRASFACSSSGPELPNHELEVAAISLQLVKPTQNFCKYCAEVDDNQLIRKLTTDIQFLNATVITNPYLCYQQHHEIIVTDIERAIKVFPTLLRVLERGPGSWVHPFGSIHRAVMFFAQGYSVSLDVLRQVLWAAGLDCLFSSKLKKDFRGSKTISRRLQKLFDSNFNPYTADTVVLPLHQQRSPICLSHIGEHILWLRNAYMHGLSLDPKWLSNQRQPNQPTYAYQLFECTEILLRATLLKIIEDSTLFETFKDPVKLDDYFSPY